ncbi:hypothetical protein ACOSQ4_016619 [Xanthoceras sorbifolium]
MDWSHAFLTEFQAAAVHHSTTAVQDRAARCWTLPACGSWKINTDAALDSNRGLVGIVIIIRDHQELVCGSSVQRLRAHFSPQVAEGVALLRGHTFAAELGFSSACVESDAAVVVASVNVGVVLGSDFGLVLHDIAVVLEQGNFSSVCFAPRECNKVAHALAKLALCLGLDLFLIDCVPHLVEYVTRADMPE